MTKIVAMPQLEDPSDFGYDDPTTNELRTHEFFSKGTAPKLIRHYGRNELYEKAERPPYLYSRSLVTPDKQRTLYVVDYMVWSVPALGRCVTQMKVWRDSSLRGHSPTKETIRELLQEYGTVVCDSRQTELGASFWQDLMREYVGTPKTVVGLREPDPESSDPSDFLLSLCFKKSDYNGWLKENLSAWGRSEWHQNYRFFISTNPEILAYENA